MEFLRERREALGGSIPARRRRADPLTAPALDLFSSQLEGTGEREISTTMAFVRVLAALLRDKRLGRHIVELDLHRDVDARITVEIFAPAAPVEAPPATDETSADSDD